MATDFKLPELGEDAPDKADVSFWYVAEGDDVEEGDDMVEMVTDKAAFTVPSPVSGKIDAILVEEGDTVQVGQVMAKIAE